MDSHLLQNVVCERYREKNLDGDSVEAPKIHADMDLVGLLLQRDYDR